MNAPTRSIPVSKRIQALFAVVAAAALVGGASDASAGKKNADQQADPFTSYAVPPPDCTSPVGICTMGTLTGTLAGSYYFVMDSLAPDPNMPWRFLYTGHSVITDGHGHHMYGADTGEMYPSLDPTQPSPFVTTVHVVDGDHEYSNVHGQVVATGALTFATGLAAGTYVTNLWHGND
ncbi:MAG: hypothetical protein U0359_23270 [Byssovorax sp.]